MTDHTPKAFRLAMLRFFLEAEADSIAADEFDEEEFCRLLAEPWRRIDD